LPHAEGEKQLCPLAIAVHLLTARFMLGVTFESVAALDKLESSKKRAAFYADAARFFPTCGNSELT
jgi:hypothetical protein